MELNVTISVLVLLPIALALVAGGLVLYRRSRRVGWRAVGMSAIALGVGTLAVFTLTLPVSKEGEAPEPEIAEIVGQLVPTQSTDAPATQQEAGGQVSSSMMVPRPESVEVLVRMSHIIVLGTISGVLDEKLIGAYGEDGNPYIPSEESGTPYTDYEVRVESVLKDDGDVEDGGTLVLRMWGHLSQQNDVVTLAAVTLPQPGAHYLLALGRNPDGTYGSGNEGLIYVDGETVAYVDGIPFSTKLLGQEFVEPVRQEVGQAQGQPGPSGSPGNTSPVIPVGSPLVNLTYEGAVYYAAALSTDDAANLNENNLELVGTATESNLLLPAGSDIRHFIVDLNQDSPELTVSEIKDRVEAKFQIGIDKSAVGRILEGGLNIYKLKDGEEGYVYTFEPGRSKVNPEDGQIFKGQDVWTRWTTP